VASQRNHDARADSRPESLLRRNSRSDAESNRQGKHDQSDRQSRAKISKKVAPTIPAQGRDYRRTEASHERQSNEMRALDARLPSRRHRPCSRSFEFVLRTTASKAGGKNVEIIVTEIGIGFGNRVRFKGRLRKFAGEEVPT
jgi:hypothetical protein